MREEGIHGRVPFLISESTLTLREGWTEGRWEEPAAANYT